MKFIAGIFVLAGILSLVYVVSQLSTPSPDNNGGARTPVRTIKTERKPIATTRPPSSKTARKEDQGLLKEREYDADLLSTIESIVNAPSFARRAEIYCRFTIEQREALGTPLLGMSGKEIESRYAELLRAEPTTREGELQRQQGLAFLEQFVMAHRENLSACQTMAVSGMQPIPTDQEFREKAAEAQQDIIRIDRQIASGVSDSDSFQPVAPKTPQPPQNSEPVLLHKVEPEYSPEARKANFNGDVKADITIDQDGNVSSVRVLDSPGLGLDENIIDALHRWKFKPAMKDGAPVPVNRTVTLTFRRM